ncbi:MAG: ABC transporter substrate-binding protein, partial [Chloroflexi bacterium]|jgi:ABC-type nitrate/sulfonate/bicarbonate transport system substrate-binding protein|nr:ABC transporter substrate-binding protein [Chloroflexota bacterium]
VLTEGLVDVYPVFNSNEPYLLRQWGYDLMQWEPAEYDIPTLGLTYVSTPDMIEENPERMARFVRAALRGIAYAEAHPEEAVEITMNYAGPETDPAHMRFMLETELADARSEVTAAHASTIGWQTVEQWQALHDILLDYDAIAHAVNVTEAFTTEFLKSERLPEN